MSVRKFAISGIVVVVLGFAGCSRGQEAGAVSYAKDIQPIFDRECASCHTGDGEGLLASGFNTGSYEEVMKGTRYGSMIEPGDPLSSSLYRLVSGREVHPSIRMPKGDGMLPESDIELIETWIRQGAQDN
jgi:mono/diheme cytochrome c family protein